MEELLLIKPQTNHYYIKKNKAYIHNYLGIVNKQNQIIGLGMDPQQLFLKTGSLTPKIKRIIGTSKLKKADNNDTWSIIQYSKICKFQKPIPTSKPVRGIRYAQPEETKEFKLQLTQKIAEPYHLTHKDILYGTKGYADLYRKCSENELLGELFELEKNGEIIWQF